MMQQRRESMKGKRTTYKNNKKTLNTTHQHQLTYWCLKSNCHLTPSLLNIIKIFQKTFDIHSKNTNIYSDNSKVYSVQ